MFRNTAPETWMFGIFSIPVGPPINSSNFCSFWASRMSMNASPTSVTVNVTENNIPFPGTWQPPTTTAATRTWFNTLTTCFLRRMIEHLPGCLVPSNSPGVRFTSGTVVVIGVVNRAGFPNVRVTSKRVRFPAYVETTLTVKVEPGANERSVMFDP